MGFGTARENQVFTCVKRSTSFFKPVAVARLFKDLTSSSPNCDLRRHFNFISVFVEAFRYGFRLVHLSDGLDQGVHSTGGDPGSDAPHCYARPSHTAGSRRA